MMENLNTEASIKASAKVTEKATEKNKSFYITTPLYYPSGKWHLGHSYTTVCCDALARYRRLAGDKVFYLTGTDEHGQKIAESAEKAGTTPQKYVDGLVGEIKELWALLDIKYDKFIRTTDDYHIKSVQKIFKTLYDKGDIYKSAYSGKYCTPCEAFWTGSQLKDGSCPDCGRAVKDSEEECYFFRLSKFADKLEELLLKTDFLQPSHRAKEMYNNFIKPGLSDLAVSRTSVKWGVPVDFDNNHTVYVWIDALSNYINGLGYNGDNLNMDLWRGREDKGGEVVHMVGKEIVRFHTIIWPALLMALDLPVPKTVYGHGWLLLEGDKMSKSKGNVADPFVLVNRYGVDAVRYYLLAEIPFGADGVYSDEAFLTKLNADLVNSLGNLVKRTLAMTNQYFGGKAELKTQSESAKQAGASPVANEIIEFIDLLGAKVDAQIKALSCSGALAEIFNVISRANKYIDETAPWVLNKEGKTERLEEVLYNLLEAIRVCATFLLPFIPRGAEKIFEGLGLPVPGDFKKAKYGAVKKYKVGKDEILYARLDVKKELAALSGE